MGYVLSKFFECTCIMYDLHAVKNLLKSYEKCKGFQQQIFKNIDQHMIHVCPNT